MNFDLEIYFVDLMAYVVDENQLWILMPKADDHKPLLIYRTSDFFSSSSDEFLVRKDTMSAWPLDDRHLEIVDADNRLLPLTGRSRNPLPDRRSLGFGWVTPMKEMSERNEGRAKDSLVSMTGNPNALLASRMLLKAGTVSTRHFCIRQVDDDGNDSTDFQIYTYQFIPGADIQARALVNGVKAVVEIPGDNVTLRASKFGTSSCVQELVLHPSNGKVEIVVGNLAPSGQADLDHFGNFYKLVHKWEDIGEKYIPDRLTGSDRKPLGQLNEAVHKLPPMVKEFNEIHKNNPLAGITSIQLDRESCPHVRLEMPE